MSRLLLKPPQQGAAPRLMKPAAAQSEPESAAIFSHPSRRGVAVPFVGPFVLRTAWGGGPQLEGLHFGTISHGWPAPF